MEKAASNGRFFLPAAGSATANPPRDACRCPGPRERDRVQRQGWPPPARRRRPGASAALQDRFPGRRSVQVSDSGPAKLGLPLPWPARARARAAAGLASAGMPAGPRPPPAPYGVPSAAGAWRCSCRWPEVVAALHGCPTCNAVGVLRFATSLRVHFRAPRRACHRQRPTAAARPKPQQPTKQTP